MIKALQELSKGQQALQQQQLSQAHHSNAREATSRLTEGDDMAVTDKMNAIAGFEFKQSLPVIKGYRP